MFVPIFYEAKVNSSGYSMTSQGGLIQNPDGIIERRRFTYDTVAQFNEMHRKIGTPDETDSVLEFSNAWGHLFYNADYRDENGKALDGSAIIQIPQAPVATELMKFIQRKIEFPITTPFKPEVMDIVHTDYEDGKTIRKNIPHVAPMNLFFAIYHASQFSPDTKYRVCEYRRRHKKARPRIGSTCPAGCIISTGRTGKAIWGDGCRQYEKTKTSRAKKKYITKGTGVRD